MNNVSKTLQLLYNQVEKAMRDNKTKAFYENSWSKKDRTKAIKVIEKTIKIEFFKLSKAKQYQIVKEILIYGVCGGWTNKGDKY